MVVVCDVFDFGLEFVVRDVLVAWFFDGILFDFVGCCAWCGVVWGVVCFGCLVFGP